MKDFYELQPDGPLYGWFESPDESWGAFGSLYRVDGHEWELKLHEGVQFTDIQESLPVVLGDIEIVGQVVLTNVMILESLGDPHKPKVARLSFNSVLRPFRSEDLQVNSFENVLARLSGLGEFTGHLKTDVLSPVQSGVLEERPDTKKEIVSLSSCMVSVVHSLSKSYSGGHGDIKRFSASSTPMLLLEGKGTLITKDEAREFAEIATSFITFMTQNISETLWMELASNMPSWDDRHQVTVYSNRHISRRVVQRNHSWRGDHLVRLYDELDHPGMTARMLTRWIALHRHHNHLVSLLLSPYYLANEGPVELPFLHSLQFLETFHRTYMDRTPVSQEAWNEWFNKISENLSSKQRGTLKHRLRGANQLWLGDRLKDCADRADFGINGLFEISDNFVIRSVQTRNYYAHYDPTTTKDRFSDQEMLMAGVKWRIVGESLVLRLLGLPRTYIKQSVQRSKTTRQLDNTVEIFDQLW